MILKSPPRIESTTAPSTAGVNVYDGASAGVDAAYNNSLLNSLSANWTAFDASISGLVRYEYAIGTTSGGSEVTGSWLNNLTSTSVTNNTLSLRTSQLYYVSVRAIDAAGGTSAVVTSNGQVVAPSLVSTVGASTITFTPLNQANSYTDTKTLTVNTTTNGYGGYQTRAYATTPTSSSSNIPAYSSPWTAPTAWSGTGFGFTSTDLPSGQSNSYASCGGPSTCYAGFPTSLGSAAVVADHTTAIVGSSVTENTTLTLRIAVPPTQASGAYVGRIVISTSATF